MAAESPVLFCHSCPTPNISPRPRLPNRHDKLMRDCRSVLRWLTIRRSRTLNSRQEAMSIRFPSQRRPWSYLCATAIALFGGASDTNNLTGRAQALRQAAENQNLYNAEFNRAFVLMQFFG